MTKLIPVALAAMLLAACSSAPIKETAAPKVEDKSTAAAPAATPAAPPAVTVNPLKDPNNILSKRSVYFDFDSSVVRDEFRSLVQAHAKYLTGNGSARMSVQGNTDERGSSEYNLALGQRRADSVKRALTVLGAGDSQIATVSFGKEKPTCTQADESCWSKNRRADMAYPGD